MLINQNARVLTQQNAKCWPAKSSWTYNSTAGSATVTVLTASPPAVGDYVSLAPSGGGFAEQIVQVQTVSAGVSFTVFVWGDTTTVTGGAFAGSGELALFRHKVLGGTMGRNGTLVLIGKISCTGSAGAKKLRSYLGSGVFSLQGFNNVAVIAGMFMNWVSNRNDEAKQIGGLNDSSQSGSFNLATGIAFPTLTQDTKTDLDVKITCERITTTEDFSLESVQLILIPGTF